MRAAALGLALCGTATAAPVLESQRDPHEGIHHEVWVDAAVPARIHLVRLDLTLQGIALYATKEADKGITTKQYADRIGAEVAINGDAFDVSAFYPRGLAAGDGLADTKVWTTTADDELSSVLHLRRVGERTEAAIEPPQLVTTFEALPMGTQSVVSGRPLIVRSGGVEPEVCDDPTTVACERAPQSAVAISEDGRTMWLAVVDGWQVDSIGLRARELGVFLKGRGAYMAMALDGGGSSTLVMDGVTVNKPSDGVARAVANHLAVKFMDLDPGTVLGFICEGNFTECGDPAKQLPGAKVTLDDGRSMVVGSDAKYTFADVTPRTVCATASLAGYQSATRCLQLPKGETIYMSIGLAQGQDPPDAGVPGDGGGGVNDGGLTDDAGNPIGGGGGGCCDARRGSVSYLLLVVVVAWMLGRRRGTLREA